MPDIGDIINGRYEILHGPIAIQGVEGCRDVRCRRRRGPDGRFDWSRCDGYHCPHCGEASSMYGHYTTIAFWAENDDPESYGTAVKFPGEQGYFTCQPGFAEAVDALREDHHG